MGQNRTVDLGKIHIADLGKNRTVNLNTRRSADLRQNLTADLGKHRVRPKIVPPIWKTNSYHRSGVSENRTVDLSKARIAALGKI